LQSNVKQLPSPPDGLRELGLVFRAAVDARRGEMSSWQTASRSHLDTAISRADERPVEKIEDAQAPFWLHVRDAVAERHP
jgi:hypothetical protein